MTIIAGMKYTKVLFHLFIYLFLYKKYIEPLLCADFVQDARGNKVNEARHSLYFHEIGLLGETD